MRENGRYRIRVNRLDNWCEQLAEKRDMRLVVAGGDQ